MNEPQQKLPSLSVGAKHGDDPEARLLSIVEASERVEPGSEEARALRVQLVEQLPDLAGQEVPGPVGRFVAEHLDSDDFGHLAIDDPKRAAAVCEALLSFRFDDDDASQKVHELSRALLIMVAKRFEERGQLGRVVRLLQVAPTRGYEHPELIRLRGRAHLWEMRRAGRLRKILYTYLVLQALLVTVLFPFLFINAENGRLQQMVEDAVSVELDEQTVRQRLTYIDGLYWSIITAASIGYGDVTPKTNVGRALAATLGTLGVLTVGVMAGLILFWITPRKLE